MWLPPRAGSIAIGCSSRTAPVSSATSGVPDATLAALVARALALAPKQRMKQSAEECAAAARMPAAGSLLAASPASLQAAIAAPMAAISGVAPTQIRLLSELTRGVHPSSAIHHPPSIMPVSRPRCLCSAAAPCLLATMPCQPASTPCMGVCETCGGSVCAPPAGTGYAPDPTTTAEVGLPLHTTVSIGAELTDDDGILATGRRVKRRVTHVPSFVLVPAFLLACPGGAAVA